MKTLIIYAHPNVEGHCSLILDEVTSKLPKRSYALVDLYKTRFDPVLHEEELYTSKGHDFIHPVNKNFQKLISKADNLIFIYPAWWGHTPAILKGWFDRVLTSPFAFKYIRHPILSPLMGAIPVPRLKGKKAAVFVTSGAKKWQSLIFMGNRFKKIISKDTLGFCGIKSKVFQLGGAGSHPKSRTKEVQKLVKSGLHYLNL